MRLNKKAIIVATCAACTLGLAAGCAPQQSENAGAAAPSGDGGAVPQEQKLTPEQQAVIDGAEGTTNEDIDENYYPGKEYLDNLWDRWDQVATEYAPEVRTLPNGQMVQRTPTEYEVNPDAWQIQAGSNSYNTYWLDADNRGCESCHADMNSLLKHLPYEHPVAWNDELDNKTTLQQCLFCHSYAPGYIAKQYEFGTLIHNVHYGLVSDGRFEDEYKGNCYSCHDATNDGEGMALWDQTKFERLRGVTKVENVEGDFSIDQETTMAQEDMFNMDAWNRLYDRMRSGASTPTRPCPRACSTAGPSRWTAR